MLPGLALTRPAISAAIPRPGVAAFLHEPGDTVSPMPAALFADKFERRLADVGERHSAVAGHSWAIEQKRNDSESRKRNGQTHPHVAQSRIPCFVEFVALARVYYLMRL